MAVDIFSQQQNTPDIIAKDVDTDKFQKIVSILCAKRKNLEESFATASPEAKANVQALIKNLTEEMKTFGISELDYQKYLLIQEKNK